MLLNPPTGDTAAPLSFDISALRKNVSVNERYAPQTTSLGQLKRWDHNSKGTTLDYLHFLLDR